MQNRLGLKTSCGALDFNLGCSGYIYGLGLAKGLIETGQARNVLLVTAETYSKFIHPGDKSVRTLFGDAAAATFVQYSDKEPESIGPFVYGTDGRGADKLIVHSGGMRQRPSASTKEANTDNRGNVRSQENLFMDGPELFSFTLDSIPGLVSMTLERAQLRMEDISYFVFHQANSFMLESLRKKIGIPEEKFVIKLESCGNTVSSTIPIALQDLATKDALHPGQILMLVGFGVGYSLGATIVRIPQGAITTHA